ncbi:hypothetical protein ACFL3S_12500 [Gemmatimonadota bacterium]
MSEPASKDPLVRSLSIGAVRQVLSSTGIGRGLSPVVAFLLSLLVSCSDPGLEPEEADPTPQITRVELHLVSGADQAGLEGHFLGEPVVVRVTDEDGSPIDQVPLRFSIVHGGGLLHGSWVPQRTVDVLSDARGLAQVNWELGTVADHVLKVSIPLETNGVGNTFTGKRVYVFAGMEAELSVQWTTGHEFRTESGVIPHDDRILETPHFLVFSDGSSDDAKIVFAAMAEESLHEILEAFGVPETEELGFDRTDPATKLTIYSNQTLQHEQRTFSFRFGFIAPGKDTGVYPSVWLRQVVKHELMHVFVWLVQLRWTALENPGHRWYLDTWFSEGLSEHVAGGSWMPIRTLSGLNAWRAHPDHTNPISIRDWGFFPESVIERSNGFEYYPMFDLAVRYLLDEAGFGRDYSDVMAMFLDMNAGTDFWFAFERHMGIPAEYFEDAFFDLMADYLPPL